MDQDNLSFAQAVLSYYDKAMYELNIDSDHDDCKEHRKNFMI